jgi:hypothetical protein
MALYARHPRFTVALLILIFISLVMFASDSASLGSVRSAAFGKSRDAALAEALASQEMYYEEMLQRRQQLIKKWGPTPDQVDP